MVFIEFSMMMAKGGADRFLFKGTYFLSYSRCFSLLDCTFRTLKHYFIHRTQKQSLTGRISASTFSIRAIISRCFLMMSFSSSSLKNPVFCISFTTSGYSFSESTLWKKLFRNLALYYLLLFSKSL